MASKITLKNLEQQEFTIQHPDGVGAGTIKSTDITYKIDTVDDFTSVPSAFDTVIVKDKDRGGVFNKIASTTANGGTVFDGTGCSWERQYSGVVNVKWFGAVDDWDGATGTDNQTAIQNAIDYASSNSKTLIISGNKYRVDGGLKTKSNLHMVFKGEAQLVPTAWSDVGAFLTNVILPTTSTASIQSNITLERPNIDCAFLPYDLVSNDNAIGFARGASNVTIIEPKVYNCKFSYSGGGAGGKAINFEGGVDNAFVDNLYAENCGMAMFTQGQDGTWSNGASKQVTKVIVTSIVAENCECVYAGFGIDTTQDPDGDPNDNFVQINEIMFHNCGHAPTRPVGGAYQEKSGIITFGEGQNITVNNVKGWNDATYPSSYPTDPNVVGFGLSGPVGAVIWGWGRNVNVKNIEYHGDCDQLIQINRARALGDDAGGTGIIQNVFRYDIDNLKHYGACDYIANMQGAPYTPDEADVRVRLTDIYLQTLNTAFVAPIFTGFGGVYLEARNLLSNYRNIKTTGFADQLIAKNLNNFVVQNGELNYVGQSIQAEGLLGEEYLLNDNTAIAIEPPSTYGTFLVVSDTSLLRAQVAFRVGWSSQCVNMGNAVSNFATTTGVLSGTTGADTTFTVSADATTGKIYLENRRGATVTFRLLFLG